MKVFEIDVFGQEFQAAISIYHILVQKYDSVPQLSEETLFFNYYDDIKSIITPLFDYWLSLEIAVPKNEQERQMLLSAHIADYQKKLFQLTYDVWYHTKFTFTDIKYFNESGVFKIVNDARQGVW